MKRKYFIMSVWSIVAIILMAGCSASEDITSEPELTLFSNSECKNDASYSPKITDDTADAPTRYELMPPMISLVYYVEGGKLDLHFENIPFYCNFAPVKFIAKVEENVISIGYLPSYMGEYADCVCQADLDCSLEKLSPGKYILDIYNLEWLNKEIPEFPDDPKYPKFSEEVDLTKDITISFPY